MSLFNLPSRFFLRAFPFVFAITIISDILEQYTTTRIQDILSSPTGAKPILYAFILASILASVFFPLITGGFAILASSSNSFSESWAELCKSFEQLLIENLRAWGSTLTWALVFIIPAFYRHLQLIFLPFVVLKNSNYKNGQMDALQTSAKIFKTHWMKTTTLLIFFHFLLPTVLVAVFDKYMSYSNTPISALALTALETYINLYSIHLLIKIFYSPESIKVQESFHESYV